MSGEGEPGGRDLAQLFAEGRAAWPGVEVSLDAFTSFARARLAAEPGASAHPDIYLACACAAGAPGALSALERAVLADVPKAIRRVDPDPDFVADVAADLRLSLVSGTAERPPALEGYRGRGPLRSFVMVLAMRRAVDRKRRVREIVTEPSSLADAAAGETPTFARGSGSELRAAFLAALREELSALAPRDRNVLRLHVVEGVSVEAIAKMYNVHRATVARWVAQAKEQVFAETRAALERKLALSPDTFESFARGEALELDAQLSTFLREE